MQIAEIKNYNQNPLPLDRIDINVEPDLLWNSASGILAMGDQVTDSDSPPYRNAVYRKMSEQGKSVEGEIVYRPSGQGTAFQQPIRLKLDMDYYSMDMPQKSLRIEAADKPFEYQLFDDRDALTYQSILLRDAGNDSLFTRIADGVQSRLIDLYLGTNIQTLAWKPVSVYLNGKYWGIYNMRESPDAYTICRHENIDPDKVNSVTILKLDGTAIQGNNAEYSEMISAVSSGNPGRITEDLAFLEQNIDVDSYLNWLAVKAYFGDLDAASTFICYQIPGQKWKCLAYDFDYGLFQASYDSISDMLKESGMGPVNIDNTVFRKILEVEKYKDLFIGKTAMLYQTFTTEAMQRELDRCIAEIEPWMKEHFARWAPENDPALNPDASNDPEEARKYWEKRVLRMRDGTMVHRPQYVYEQVQNFFGLTDQEMTALFVTDR